MIDVALIAKKLITKEINVLECLPLNKNIIDTYLYSFLLNWCDIPDDTLGKRKLKINDCIYPLRCYLRATFLSLANNVAMKNISINDVDYFTLIIGNDIFDYAINNLMKTAILFEFKKIQKKGILKRDSFNEFANLTCSLEWIEYFFEEYPMVFFRVENFIQNQIIFFQEILQNIDADFIELKSSYNLKNGLLTKIAFFLGDLHNKNRSTCLIKFGSNSILYKPHSLSSDIWFYDLLYRVVGVRKINYIDKGAYGYAEFIKQGNCLYENEIKTYYYNFGVIAGLIYYLGSIDIIADNIIAGRSMPQFIDMEAVVSPNNKRNTFLSKTIFKSSILPDEFSFQKYKMSPLFKIVPNEEDFIKVKAQL